MSAVAHASANDGAASITIGRDDERSATRAWTRSGVRPATRTVRIGRTRTIAWAWARACSPVPRMASVCASGRASSSAERADAAAVRATVIDVPSSSATGSPVLGREHGHQRLVGRPGGVAGEEADQLDRDQLGVRQVGRHGRDEPPVGHDGRDPGRHRHRPGAHRAHRRADRAPQSVEVEQRLHLRPADHQHVRRTPSSPALWIFATVRRWPMAGQRDPPPTRVHSGRQVGFSAIRRRRKVAFRPLATGIRGDRRKPRAVRDSHLDNRRCAE